MTSAQYLWRCQQPCLFHSLQCSVTFAETIMEISSFCAWPRLKLILVLVCPFHLKSRDTTNGMGLLTVSDWGFCWLCTKIHWTVRLGALAQSNQSPHHLPTEQITLLLARPPGQLRPCYWPVSCLCTYIIKLYMYVFCYLSEYLVMSLSKHLFVSLWPCRAAYFACKMALKQPYAKWKIWAAWMSGERQPAVWCSGTSPGMRGAQKHRVDDNESMTAWTAQRSLLVWNHQRKKSHIWTWIWSSNSNATGMCLQTDQESEFANLYPPSQPNRGDQAGSAHTVKAPAFPIPSGRPGGEGLVYCLRWC